MRKFNISLFGFLMLVTSMIFLTVAIYERDRANEIESNSIVLSSPEYRAIVDMDMDIMKRELQLQVARRQFTNAHPSTVNQSDEIDLVPVAARRGLANLRNAELKLKRRKSMLANMRSDAIRRLDDSPLK